MTKGVRTGAKSLKEIPTEILEQLHEGQIESANLTEWLAIDHCRLIRCVLPVNYQNICLANIDQLKSRSVMQMIKSIGESLSSEIKQQNDKLLFDKLKFHKSDSVRCWATYIVGFNDQISFDAKLKEIKSFAADTHFGVREIAWMAVREDITQNIDQAISLLLDWTKDSDPNIRRFACESIRPNGVWCKQLERLKNNPELALPILEQLKADKSKYVQDSVSNWLNDASKTQASFVIELCEKWNISSPSKETRYIIKRALRTIDKNNI